MHMNAKHIHICMCTWPCTQISSQAHIHAILHSLPNTQKFACIHIRYASSLSRKQHILAQPLHTHLNFLKQVIVKYKHTFHTLHTHTQFWISHNACFKMMCYVFIYVFPRILVLEHWEGCNLYTFISIPLGVKKSKHQFKLLFYFANQFL